ncbi:MAG: TetR/AcrR family transcriptional regulator [Myxococcota bacterium]
MPASGSKDSISKEARAAARAPLSQDAIVRAVLDVGVNRFSMHSVARHLGVTATALYRHVGSRDELLALAMEAYCARIVLPDASLEWRPYLEALAHGFRDTLLAMPGAAEYGTKIGPATPSAFAIVDHAIGVLREAGFSALGAWRAYSLVVNYAFSAVQGLEHFARLEAEHGSGGFRVFQLSAEERASFPNLAWTTDGIDFDFDATFDANLKAIVAGLEPG